MSDKPLPVDGAVVKPETIGRTGVPGQAMRSVRAVLNNLTGNNQAFEGPDSPRGPAPDRAQTVLDPGPTQAEIDGLIALCSQRRFQEALEYGTALAERHPTAVILHNILGGVNAGLGRLDQALVCITRAVQIEPDYAEAHYNLGKALEALGRIEEAIASYAKAVQIKPDFAEAHNNLGTVLNNLSKHDEAIASYSRALQIKPDYAQALRNLSTLKKFEIDDPQIAQMEEAISNPLVTENDRMQLSFALGKAYDDIGDAENAFRHFLAGNNLKKKELGYDIGSDRRLISLIKSIFSAVELPNVPETPPVTPNGKRPIFIVGMPRSGTTLVEQILASHSQVHGAGELEILNRIVRPVLDDIRQVHSGRLTAGSLEAVRGGYLTELNGIGGDERFIVDKMPLNFRWIGFIMTAIPEAMIVNLQRDPVANCWSVFKNYFVGRGNGYSYSLTDAAEFYKMYVDLMKFWRGRFPSQIYDLNYEALTENQEEETRVLLKYCDLDWEDQCLEFHKTERAVKTASALQVRQEMYKGSSEAWRRYEVNLQPMLRVLRG